MSETISRPLIALTGNPNTGKTALFNALTGSRQRVANYPGVTVERKEGFLSTPSGKKIQILDLPGAYSLDAKTPDEEITRNVLLGLQQGEKAPDIVVAVADTTNLERSLGFVLELKELGHHVILALNMFDLAKKRGLEFDLPILVKELGVPVVATVATKKEGIHSLIEQMDYLIGSRPPLSFKREWVAPTAEAVRSRFAEVDRILGLASKTKVKQADLTDKIDRILLHPLWGHLILLAILITMFQAVFSWAEWPMTIIDTFIERLGLGVAFLVPPGALQSLLVDGVIAGVGSVLVFLPQILILFFFVLALEDSGYMARAAFLMDRWMSKVGLHGKAFVPLLSSHACAIPGIMATRTIENPKDRIATILMAPLTTCSARLPIYALLIAAFIPKKTVWGFFQLQALVMLALYVAGIASALLIGLILKKTILKGPKPFLMLELPTYKVPALRNLFFGLYERGRVFLRRAGTIILGLSILLWFLASYPKPPANADLPDINYSFAGLLGHALEPAIRPLGFNWHIGTGLIPGFAAREVMVSALATVYAVGAQEEEETQKALSQTIASQWSFATALSLLVWYIFAPQCLATLAVVKRETNSWRWPALMFVYMLGLAYLASFVTYQVMTL